MILISRMEKDLKEVNSRSFYKESGAVIGKAEISAEANKRKVENIYFKKELKKFSSEIVDGWVAKLNAHYEKVIDCKVCGNCCSKLEPGVEDNEIEKLAEAMMEDPVSFRRNRIDFDGRALYLKTKPCLFLKDCKCTVYEIRPAACAGFPHLDQPHFKYKQSVWANYEICPIVYEVVEGLKRALDFQKQGFGE